MPRTPVFALLMCAAFGLRLLLLDQKNLWLDEAASWDLATNNLDYLIAKTAADVHPPLYYLLLKVWIGLLGDSAGALRSLSVAADVLCVAFVFSLARRTLPLMVAVAATLWVAVSPHAVYFAQEARMYAPVSAAVLGFCLAYRVWVDSRFVSRLALAGYVVGVTCALYLHYFSAFAVVAVWAHVLWLRPFPWRRWLSAHAVIAVLYLPWASVAVTQLERGQPWRAPVELVSLPVHALNLVKGLAIGEYTSGWSAFLPAALLAAGLGAGVVQLLRARYARIDVERHAFFVILAVLPMALALAALPVTGELFLPRYLVFSQPLVVLAIASTLTRSTLSARGSAVVLCVAAVASVPSLLAYYGAASKDSDIRPIVRYLETRGSEEVSRDNPVAVAPGYMAMTLRFVEPGMPSRRVDTPADLEGVLGGSGPGAGRSRFLVVDYRWPNAGRLRTDPRLEPVPVPGAVDERLTLYRVGPG